MINSKVYLGKIILDKSKIEDDSVYPYNLPFIKNINEITFNTSVTFIIGENGAGKSTLIEAIAIKMGLNAEGGTKSSTFSTSKTHSNLHTIIKNVKGIKRPTDWYFLRAESFYNLASLMDEVNYLGPYGGKSLHMQSHGESFMAVLSNKLKGNGFYILDEPEAALSPSRQLSALIQIDRLVKQNSQLIIATHSPILMSYPNSKILHLTDNGLKEVSYKETDHFLVTKDFLNNREYSLKHLLKD